MTVTQARADAKAPDTPRRAGLLRLLALRGWRSLTSMGTALVLLFLLALGAVPGALLPQRSLNESKVAQYLGQHPTLGPWLDRLQLFDVFSSFWFTAIYVLLFVSLVGCLTPRILEHLRSLRASPVPAPRNLSRLPKHAEATVGGSAEQVAARVSRAVARLAAGQSHRRRGHRDIRGEGLSARVRQYRLPFLAAGPAGRRRGRQVVRLRGQRHRHRQRRSRVLLGLTGGLSTRSGPATMSTAPGCTRCASGSTISRPVICRPGRPHRSPRISTIRPARTCRPAPGGRIGWRSTIRCGSAATGSTCRVTATPRPSP